MMNLGSCKRKSWREQAEMSILVGKSERMGCCQSVGKGESWI